MPHYKARGFVLSARVNLRAGAAEELCLAASNPHSQMHAAGAGARLARNPILLRKPLFCDGKRLLKF